MQRAVWSELHVDGVGKLAGPAARTPETPAQAPVRCECDEFLRARIVQIDAVSPHRDQLWVCEHSAGIISDAANFDPGTLCEDSPLRRSGWLRGANAVRHCCSGDGDKESA
jgi:hypothetical protein